MPIALEHVRRWWYAVTVAAFALVAAWSALMGEIAPAPPEPAPARSAHNPAPARLDTTIRNPFMTGTEWRSYQRALLEPPPPTKPLPPPLSQRPLEADLPTIEGTMQTGKVMFAVIGGDLYKPGSMFGKFKIISVDNQQVVFEAEGRRLSAKVPE